MWFSTPFTCLTAVLVCVWQVTSQATTNVTCKASTVWMANAYQQNPCLVAAYLSSACNGREWMVPTLEPKGSPYESLVAGAACAYCQNGTTGKWSAWISNCPPNFINISYPVSVPAETSIPPWAVLDPTITDLWNATWARAFAGAAPEGIPQVEIHKKSNIRAIVGGVVGSITGFLLIAGFPVYQRFFAKPSRTPTPPVEDTRSHLSLKATSFLAPPKSPGSVHTYVHPDFPNDHLSLDEFRPSDQRPPQGAISATPYFDKSLEPPLPIPLPEVRQPQ